MGKYSGYIGYAVQKETKPGVYEDDIFERHYYGDVIRYRDQFQNGVGLNDDINVNHVISIIANPYARDHIHQIRYITWRGQKWKVTGVDEAYPRLNLNIGGLYHEQTET